MLGQAGTGRVAILLTRLHYSYQSLAYTRRPSVLRRRRASVDEVLRCHSFARGAREEILWTLLSPLRLAWRWATGLRWLRNRGGRLYCDGLPGRIRDRNRSRDRMRMTTCGRRWETRSNSRLRIEWKAGSVRAPVRQGRVSKRRRCGAMRACAQISASALTSNRLSCWFSGVFPKRCWKTTACLWLASSFPMTFRHTLSVSTTATSGKTRPLLAHSAVTIRTSKDALWATSTTVRSSLCFSLTHAMKRFPTTVHVSAAFTWPCAGGGVRLALEHHDSECAARTCSFVIPWIDVAFLGIARRGFTSDENSRPSHDPAILTMRSYTGDRPLVSVSQNTNAAAIARATGELADTAHNAPEIRIHQSANLLLGAYFTPPLVQVHRHARQVPACLWTRLHRLRK